jgi:hypothetical protein
MNVLFIAVFNGFGPDQGHALEPSIQILIVSLFAMGLSVALTLWRPNTVQAIVPEQSTVVANCCIVFERLVATLRLPKKRRTPSRASFELYDLHDSDYLVAPLPNASPETRRLLAVDDADGGELQVQRETEEATLRQLETDILRQLEFVRSMMSEISEETYARLSGNTQSDLGSYFPFSYCACPGGSVATFAPSIRSYSMLWTR